MYAVFLRTLLESNAFENNSVKILSVNTNSMTFDSLQKNLSVITVFTGLAHLFLAGRQNWKAFGKHFSMQNQRFGVIYPGLFSLPQLLFYSYRGGGCVNKCAG